MNPFTQSLQNAGDTNLINHFRELASTDLTHEGVLLGEAIKIRACTLIICVASADHHRQRPIFSTGLAT